MPTRESAIRQRALGCILRQCTELVRPVLCLIDGAINEEAIQPSLNEWYRLQYLPNKTKMRQEVELEFVEKTIS